MFHGILATAVAALLVPLAVVADEVKKDKEPVVREIDLKGVKLEAVRGRLDKPTVIANAEELGKTFADEELRTRLKKEVDFAKQQMLYFAWSGSGGDKLEPKVEEGKVLFQYKPGLTRDLRPHFKLFVLPKDATWKIDGK